MEFPTSELVGLFYKLLPGFVAAWIFHALTAHPKPTPFERTVQALIFTALTQSLVIVVRWAAIRLGKTWIGPHGEWTENTSFVTAVGFAIALGLIFSACANTGCVHRWLPDWLTKRTSFPSEWFSAFNKDKRKVYLHLKDGRRIYGWPYEWPDSCDRGHFVLMDVAWVLDDNRLAKLLVTERMLIPAKSVLFVEFEKSESEHQHTPDDHAESVKMLLATRENKVDEPERADARNGHDVDGIVQRAAPKRRRRRRKQH